MSWELQVEVRRNGHETKEKIRLNSHKMTLQELIQYRLETCARQMNRCFGGFTRLDQALDAFRKETYLVILNGRRIMDLNEEISLSPLSRLVFWELE